MNATWAMSSLDVGSMRAEWEAQADIIFDVAAGEMAELGEQMAERMRMMILAAHTKTGYDRVASGRGPYAGRYETGDFYNAVGYDIDVNAAERIITVQWGWLEEWADYFADQEWGTDQIAAVGSLGDTFTLGLTRVAEILDRIST